MTKKHAITSLATASLVLGAATAGVQPAQAVDAPAFRSLGKAYELRRSLLESPSFLLAENKDAEGKCGEGKCGEGKCGGDVVKDKNEKSHEGKCGEGKCGGEDEKSHKSSEGGTSQEEKHDQKTAGEGKCGEGKCG